jgi:Na+-driven multidrug efflux pump
VSGRSAARLTLARLLPRRQHVATILRVAVPSACGTLLTNATVLVLTGLVAPFGEIATAGYGAGGRLEYLLIPLVFGIGSALVPLVAANDAAGQFERVRQFTRTGAILATGACGAVGLTVALLPDLWMRLFSSDAGVLEIGRAYLMRVGPAYPFLGLGLSLYFAAQGRGRTVPPLLATSSRLAIVGFFGTFGMTIFRWKLESLFLLMSLGLMIYALVMVAVMRRELGLAAQENPEPALNATPAG